MNDDLLGHNPRKKKYSFPRATQFPWFAYTISIGVFILNKAVQSVLGFTTDTNITIDIVVVISLVTALMIYARYYFGGKNG